ncbi:hypothetical protein RI129_008676 [Pyrocoelia pectoralis]|uniref:Thioredoxin domain-containing protein n=1 Tax=Pyrocoelia pectoralis TaxID=417401 RepID=A0AAN7VEJ7_9COLE
MFQDSLVLLLATFLIFITVPISNGEIKTENGIIVLDKNNFENAISVNEYILVMFYASWCKASQEMAPEYIKAAEHTVKLNIPVKLAKIEASEEKELCAKHDAFRFPSLKLFRRGTSLEYNGQRNYKGIVLWLKNQVRPAVRELHTVQETTKAVIDENMVIIGFFPHPSLTQLKEFVKIADSFEHPPFAYTFDKESRAQFGNESYPIVLYKNFDYNKAVFEEEITLENIKNFVKIESLPLIAELNEKTADKIFQGQVKTFLLLFVSKKDPTTDGISQLLKPFAQEFRKKIAFLSINTDDRSNLDILDFFNLQLQDMPTIAIVTNNKGGGKYKMDTPITGDNIKQFLQDFNAKRLQKFLLSEELSANWNKSDVYILAGSNFAKVTNDPLVDVLVLFHGDECEKCDVWSDLLYTVGENYRTRSDIIIAKINVDVNEFDRNPYRKIPAVLLYRKGDNRVIVYKGEPKLKNIVQFINSASEEGSTVKEEL